MSIFENLKSIHQHEEKLRSESLAIIAANTELEEHLRIVHEAMDIIYALTHDHPHRSDDELTLQMLGVRLFNASAASVKLALSGYCQIAFAQLRDIAETYFMLDYLRTNPDKIAAWKFADNRQHKKDFHPKVIRDALNNRDGFIAKKRDEMYATLCSFATHPTPQGFKLTSIDGSGEIGPFVLKPLLTAWLEESMKLIGDAAFVYAGHFDGVRPELETVKRRYFDTMMEWRKRYFPRPIS